MTKLICFLCLSLLSSAVAYSAPISFKDLAGGYRVHHEEKGGKNPLDTSGTVELSSLSPELMQIQITYLGPYSLDPKPIHPTQSAVLIETQNGDILNGGFWPNITERNRWKKCTQSGDTLTVSEFMPTKLPGHDTRIVVENKDRFRVEHDYEKCLLDLGRPIGCVKSVKVINAWVETYTR